ncbi:MAG TPA: hypothetical protein VIJ93_00595 [bacterium]
MIIQVGTDASSPKQQGVAASEYTTYEQALADMQNLQKLNPTIIYSIIEVEK